MNVRNGAFLSSLSAFTEPEWKTLVMNHQAVPPKLRLSLSLSRFIAFPAELAG